MLTARRAVSVIRIAASLSTVTDRVMTKPRYKWQALRQAIPLPPNEALIADLMKDGRTREQVLRELDADEVNVTTWLNDTYQVQRREFPDSSLIHLNIRRRDGGPILRDWRHFQQIKNELLGEECEAIELYPAESRKVDTSNKYHLWGYADPTFRFPVGMGKRDVSYEDGSVPGTRQRPL